MNLRDVDPAHVLACVGFALLLAFQLTVGLVSP